MHQQWQQQQGPQKPQKSQGAQKSHAESHEPHERKKLMDVAAASRFHRPWTLWVKKNTDAWGKKAFKRVMRMTNIKDMWQTLNHLPDALAGSTNLFFMEGDMMPLWEENAELFMNGGCWSTIVKGTPWISAMREIVMAVFGETTFDETKVKGICIVPVSTMHCIVKIWTTVRSESSGRLLQQVLQPYMNCCTPRFKAFEPVKPDFFT